MANAKQARSVGGSVPGHGRRREILVLPTDDARVVLVFPQGEVAVLEPLQVGRLRAALRDAVFALDDPENREQRQHVIPTVRAGA
ncbi:MAG: hypothetical protein M3443_15715 [Actinomycetota bacterium]|nr:hypothetical protein [Actinomycetota bacterium]